LVVTDADIDPVVAFRARLHDLFVQVRRPTYRSLETHADRDGRALRTSTVSNLLNGSGTPRWDTVETFVRACANYAHARQIRLAADLVDLDRWHADYRAMENALADRGPREQIAGRPVPSRRRRLAIPAQLPPDVSAFTGRVQYLADLDKLLPSHGPDTTAAVVISAIGGTAGVGKTALAVHWAHQVRDQFPDGQLYVNLRGFDPSGQAMDPALAVRGFLDALEVPPARIPTDPDAQAALYRSLLVDKRMLILLDNARDSTQVRPLLPGAPGCLVVVTSRNQLTSLIAAHSAYPLTLDLLTPNEAWELLAHRLGAERVTAEPDAVEEIITQCARLPLALTLVAAHATLRPHSALDALAEELRNTGHRWQTLAGDDPATDIQAVFSWSYRSLPTPAARLFRLLGLHPGPDIGVLAAASLAAVPVERVRPLLAELTRANLLTEPTHGRYTLHDLLRAYAADLTRTVDPDDQRDAAIHRMLDHYLYTGHAASRLLQTHRDLAALVVAQPGVTPETLTDRAEAMAWFTTEHRVLAAALQQAAATGFGTHAWQISWTLGEFLDLQGNWHEAALIHEAAIDAAQHAGDKAGAAFCHRSLGRTYRRLDRYDEAYTHLRRALKLLDELGDRDGQAHAHLGLSVVLDEQGRHLEALDHARRALELFRATDNRAGQATALNTIGWFQAQLGDYPQALTECQQALTLHHELGNLREEAATWDSIGYAYQHLGQYVKAVASYQHAVQMFRDLSDRYNEAEILNRLGDTHHAAGTPEGAREAWQQALTILTDLDHPDADTVRAKIVTLDATLNETPDR
jgi:tetratricopeptide (TPR) repeat protein